MARVSKNDKCNVSIMEKIKVAFICHVSNPLIRENLSLYDLSLKNFIKKCVGRKPFHYHDYGSWNTYTFSELEKYENLEVHVITSHPGMKNNRQDFNHNGVFYHCYVQSTDSYVKQILGIKTEIFDSYPKNRENVKGILLEVNPDVIYLVGAESPFYALSALDVDTTKKPLVVVMQTGLSEPAYLKLYPIMSEETYKKSSTVEQAIFRHAQYVATDSSWYRSIARNFNKDLIGVRYHFCANNRPKVDLSVKKEYDFAYWAANIAKAGEDALLAFCKAFKKNPSITLNMVGGYSEAFLQHCRTIMRENMIPEENVVFSGYFPTHTDALQQVAKSRFALVPIKVDIVSVSIREAVFMHMPIVTFATKGTPALNNGMERVLISNIGDHEDMAKNMLRLLDDANLANELADNAYSFAEEIWDNKKFVKVLVDEIRAVYSNFYMKEEIPPHLLECIY